MDGARPPSADDERRRERLRGFLRPMLPIAVAFFASYVGFAVAFRSVALAGGAFAVGLYVVALAVARRWAAAHRTEAAALLTGYSLLVMVLIGAFFLRFLAPALLLIGLAGVVVVLPHLEGRRLVRFMFATLGVEAWTAGWTLFESPFPDPPGWFRVGVLVVAVIAAVALVLRLLFVDATRLRESLRQAEEAVKVRDDFLSIASHELNTPLTPLMLKLRSVNRTLETAQLPAGLSKLPSDLSTITRQVERLGKLVRELLDATRLSRPNVELSLERVELFALLEEIVATLEPEAQRAGSRFDVALERGLSGLWDRVKVEQVFVNLLSNAIRYGAGKPISVRSFAREGAAWVEVGDEGAGIAPEALATIFEKYGRASSQRHYGGLGLGLFVARENVAALGGSIEVKSEVGRGSVFSVRLPLSSAGAGP